MAVQETGDRVVIRRPGGGRDPWATLPDDARRGLTASPKWLRPKYFYDARGSELFERITELPEYYQTRTERAILARVADEIVADVAPRALVEFGSGSSSKTRLLLDAMERRGLLVGYGAVEVSEAALTAAADDLVARYPALRVEGVLADFETPGALPFAGLPRLILFLGSTIGNLTREEAISFLGRVTGQMRREDGFLIGFDLVKDTETLEAAYDDAAGVTAEFNLNVLRVLNRELEGDFRLEDFRHRAFYDEARARIEMQLVAVRPVRARLAAIGLEVTLEAGEAIGTELSHKYTRPAVSAMLDEAGLVLRRWDTDPEAKFAVALTKLPA